MISDKFGSQIEVKSKTSIFTFLNVYVSWIERDKILIQNSGICRPEWTKVGTPWKWILTIFKFKNRVQKVDEQNGVICLVSFFPSGGMVLKFPKIVHFLQICNDLTKESKHIKAIYLYPSERHHHALSGNSMFLEGWATVYEMLRIKISQKVLNFQMHIHKLL